MYLEVRTEMQKRQNEKNWRQRGWKNWESLTRAKMAWMASTALTRQPTKAPAAGARQLVEERPGMSAGLSEPEGCGRKLQEGEQLR